MVRKRKNYTRPKSQYKKKAKPVDIDRKKKNFKFIKRSKETEESQRRQKFIEEKYRKNVRYDDDSMSEDENQEENPFDQLLSCFHQNKENQYKAIESSSEEEEAGEEEEVEEEDVDDDLDSSEEKEEEEVENEDGNDHDIEDEELSNDMNVSDEELNDNNSNKDEDHASADSHDDDSHDENDESESTSTEEETEEELDEELDKIENSNTLNNPDPFSCHIEKELSPKHVDNLLLKPPNVKKVQTNWSELGNLLIEIPSIESENQPSTPKKKKQLLLDTETEFAGEGEFPKPFENGKCLDLSKCYVKSQLIGRVLEANKSLLNPSPSEILTPLQAEIFCILNNYQDFFYSQRTLNNTDEIRLVYCLHALNHMIKTRTKILHHNARLSSEGKKEQAILSDTYRDQGLVRPKILIVLPFRESAFKLVNILSSLLFGCAENTKSKYVLNYNRFVEEYTGDTIHFPKRNPKPDDYERIFAGNTDDNFRIGISLTKKSMKLYTDFYSSDILLASPLGLRMIVGASGDAERDFDFLSSIEILILDQAELFLAQNWEHLLHILDHMHLQPQTVRNTDFSRVRSWYLNGLSKFYKQTIILTTHELPEFRSLFNNRCINYRGKVRQVNPILNGTIRNIIVQIPQIFHKIEVTSIQSSFDTRFNYFIKEILPQYKNPSMSHCMIYVPSYFDYVRLRNYFKTESINFVQICEYTKDGKIARARDMFFHSGAHFLLYSERGHFFRRTRIKGIRHLIMYQPPYWPHLYSEMINLMQEANQNPRDGLETSMSVTVLYTKYDMLQVSGIIGTKRASKICQTNKISHMFMTGD